MVFSLLLYVIICKIFIVLKRWTSSAENFQALTLQDPFWSLLVRGKNDFFHQENQIMLITTIQFTSLILCISSLVVVFDEDVDQEQKDAPRIIFEDVSIPLDTIFQLIWLSFIWQGTTLQVLFSKTKLIVLGILAIINIAAATYSIAAGVLDFEKLAASNKSYIVFVFSMNELCNLYSYVIYFYYGLFKRYGNENDYKIGQEAEKEI